jgi:hypothetical protein
MGMNLNRPVSDSKYYRYVEDANPARFTPLNIPDTRKRELKKRDSHSRISRLAVKGCGYDDPRGQHWRGKPRVDVNDLWIGLAKANLPVLRQRCAKDQYQNFKNREPQNRLFTTPLQRVSERGRLTEWLYRRDFLNQWVDVGPAVYHSFTSKGFFGVRNEGERAAEFASPRRFEKNSASATSIRIDHDKWNRYLCYYDMADKGRIPFEELSDLSKYVWEEADDPSVLLFKEVPEKSESASSSSKADIFDSISFSDDISEEYYCKQEPQIIVPPLAWSNQEVEKVYKNMKASQHPSGHSNEEVYSLLVKQAWKNLPGMLVKVPKSFSLETCVGLASSDSDAIDKQTRLKTG